MFPHHSSIHHFTLNDPPSPKSQVIHLEDKDITPRNEHSNPFDKKNRIIKKVSSSSIQGHNTSILLFFFTFPHTQAISKAPSVCTHIYTASLSSGRSPAYNPCQYPPLFLILPNQTRQIPPRCFIPPYSPDTAMNYKNEC
jgi:hypothetical protein